MKMARRTASSVVAMLILWVITTRGQESRPATNSIPSLAEQRLMVGWSSANITPPKPVALIGQLHKRVSTGVRDPLTATVLALETADGGKTEQAILVACDLLFIQRLVQERLQQTIRAELPDFDSAKLFLNATHTHTGPGLVDSTFKGLYDVADDPGVMKASEYAEFFLGAVAEAVVRAWRGRKPASMGWALSPAVVSYNRRAQFLDGSSVMYGNTQSPDFETIEGPEDHTVGLVSFWDSESQWSGVILNVACPSQETEHLTEVSADFWHDVRQELRRRHGAGLFLLPQCAPAGDLSPHPIYRKASEEAMDRRRGLSRREEIARRLVNALDDGLPIAQANRKSRLAFRHLVATAHLPTQPEAAPFYETDPVAPMRFHVLRLGEVAMATNPFELYLDYGIRIQARSPAKVTLLVQLSGAGSGYLPTARAVRGGGYSADKYLVGPEGGRILVEETVTRLQELFP